MAESDPSTGSGTALFVRRPVLAFVLSALVVMAGVAALFGVEIRELPDVSRPVITIDADFPGASPQTVDHEVTSRLEGAAGRVTGVESISASSEFGEADVNVEFTDSTDLDTAATDTREAIAGVEDDFPEDVEEVEVVKADTDAEPIMRIAVTATGRSARSLTELVRDRIEDRLVSAPGVASLEIYGTRDPVFRVDVDQMKLAARGLSIADVRETLADVSYDAPSGELSGDNQALTVRTTATVSTAEAFEALMIRDDVRLGDVARVMLGPEDDDVVLRTNGQTGIGMGVIQQAQSNTLEISAAVRAEVQALQESLPDDVSIFVTSDDAVFINSAIQEVLKTLTIATAIVVAIIYLFLRDARATLIPAVTLPVALIGTLAAIYLAGFSVNILTLLALVLATGLVVDDAIVVLENIVRRRSEGMGPRAAAVLGTQQVFFAVVTTTATLAAVFVPLSFLPGQAGGLFREFGFTLAMAVLLSSMVALSLCPVLASRLLTAEPAASHGPLARLGRALQRLYATTLRAALAAPLVVLAVAGLVAAAAVFAFGSVERELTPEEDRSVALMSLSAPQGVSLDYTLPKVREIEDRLQPLRQSGEITNVFSIVGFDGGSRGFMVMTLAPWGERDRSQSEIVADIDERIADIVGLRAFTLSPNSLDIRGGGRGLSFAITGGSYDQLADVADRLVDRMEENPDFGRVRLEYQTTQPQLFIDVDRSRASDLGVDIAGLAEALRAVLEGSTVGNVFIDDTIHDIRMLSTSDPVDDPGDLQRIFLQAGDGGMVPMSRFVTLEERAVAPELQREQQSRSVEISAGLTPAMSLGEALTGVENLSADILAETNTIVPLGEAATLGETSGGLGVVFGFAVLVVFLVLSAQFESFVSAIVVMATVPLGLACAIFAALLVGVSLNVYSQIGLVLLVGIMAKNGILIVEFAGQLRDAGRTVREAIFDAATIRLRPVMMTMVSTVLGGLPLILSGGAGAEAREALGWVIVGGLGLATISTLYLTPVAFLLLARFSTPRAREEARLGEELARARPA